MSLFDDASLIVTPNGFKASKLYSLKPFDGSGDLTVSRNTSATRVNESGLIELVGNNVPRLDWSSGEPSILVEPQRTNIVTYSEDFTDSSWAKTAVNVTENSIISPDGLLTSDSIVEDSTSNRHRLFKTLSKSLSEKTYSLSVYVKNLSGSRNIRINLESNIPNSKASVVFDTNGNVVLNATAIGGFTNASSSATLINGFWRYTLTATSDLGNLIIPIILLNNGTSEVYQGDGASGVYLYGAQLEQGNSTSYIPTTGTTVTRNADVLTVAPPSGTTEIVETLKDITYYIGGNNLVPNSEDFSDASWQKVGLEPISSNSINSPKGDLTADLIESNASGSSFVGDIITVSASTKYSVSIFVKKSNVDFFAIIIIDGSNVVRQYYNINDGALGINDNTVGVVSENEKIEDYSNGWYRCSLTYESVGTTLNIRNYIADTDGNLASTAGSQAYVWGAQLEQGDLTDYQATRGIVTVPTTYQLPNGEIKKVIMK